MRLVITESERSYIRSLHEQSNKDQVIKLTPETYKVLDPSIQKSVMDSIFNSQDIVTKLNLKPNMDDKGVINFLNSKGVTPYIFNKHIQGTGEKFGMLGLYMDLFGDDVKLKLNVNNISDYMLSSLPWTLVSLNVPL
jgi:hypothetical protein